jgi:hypothetical protein
MRFAQIGKLSGWKAVVDYAGEYMPVQPVAAAS